MLNEKIILDDEKSNESALITHKNYNENDDEVECILIEGNYEIYLVCLISNEYIIILNLKMMRMMERVIKMNWK